MPKIGAPATEDDLGSYAALGQSEGSGSEVDISRAKATHTANINIDDSSAMLLGGGRMPARIQRLMQTRSAVWMFVGLLVMVLLAAMLANNARNASVDAAVDDVRRKMMQPRRAIDNNVKGHLVVSTDASKQHQRVSAKFYFRNQQRSACTSATDVDEANQAIEQVRLSCKEYAFDTTAGCSHACRDALAASNRTKCAFARLDHEDDHEVASFLQLESAATHKCFPTAMLDQSCSLPEKWHDESTVLHRLSLSCRREADAAMVGEHALCFEPCRESIEKVHADSCSKGILLSGNAPFLTAQQNDEWMPAMQELYHWAFRVCDYALAPLEAPAAPPAADFAPVAVPSASGSEDWQSQISRNPPAAAPLMDNRAGGMADGDCSDASLVSQAEEAIQRVMAACDEKAGLESSERCSDECKYAYLAYDSTRCVAAGLERKQELKDAVSKKSFLSLVAQVGTFCFDTVCAQPSSISISKADIKAVMTDCKDEAIELMPSQHSCQPACLEALRSYQKSPCSAEALLEMKMSSEAKDDFWLQHAFAYDTCFEKLNKKELASAQANDDANETPSIPASPGVPGVPPPPFAPLNAPPPLSSPLSAPPPLQDEGEIFHPPPAGRCASDTDTMRAQRVVTQMKTDCQTDEVPKTGDAKCTSQCIDALRSYDRQDRGCIEEVLDRLHDSILKAKEFRITKDYLEDVCGVGQLSAVGSSADATGSADATAAVSEMVASKAWCDEDEKSLQAGTDAVDSLMSETCQQPLVAACPKLCADAMVSFDDNMCSKSVVALLSEDQKRKFTDSYMATREACSS